MEDLKTTTTTTTDFGNDWMDFFAEFQFRPDERFLNTVENQSDSDAVAEYLKGYFLITGKPYADAVAAKCETDEAKELFARTAERRPSNRMNARLDIFYSRASNGCDNLEASGLLPHAETVWCDYETGTDEPFAKYFFEKLHRRQKSHVALFRRFMIDNNGKPAFFDTPLTSAMKNGTAVILQHVNLLPVPCQQQIRGVTDEKTHVVIGEMPEALDIQPGFKIVATMNLLASNGQIVPLSPLLADRASSIREYRIDEETLANAAF